MHSTFLSFHIDLAYDKINGSIPFSHLKEVDCSFLAPSNLRSFPSTSSPTHNRGAVCLPRPCWRIRKSNLEKEEVEEEEYATDLMFPRNPPPYEGVFLREVMRAKGIAGQTGKDN